MLLTRFRLSIALTTWLISSLTLAATVENVRSYRAPDYTRLVFDLSESVDYRVFTLDNPQRIVVDLYDSTLIDDFNSIDLSSSPIQSIRSSIREGDDVRVVFDLSAKVQPDSFLLDKNEQYGNRLVIDFYDEGASTTSNTRPANPGSRSSSSEPIVSASVDDLANGQRDIVVAISAGHGGDDPGAVGVDQIQEKRVVLSLAREIEQLLERTPGYRPVMIREGDYYVDLERRPSIAHDNHADLFIAIHADAFSSTQARGATIYGLSRRGATSEQARRLAAKENSADLIGGVGSVSIRDKEDVLASVLLDLSITESIKSSLAVGKEIISSLSDVTRMRRSTVEQANFVVLRSPDIPSLLIEAGYITNPTDARNLNSSAFRGKFATAVVSGITSYFYNTPPAGSWVSWRKNNSSGPSSYTVSRGDNLSEIAQRFGISVNALKSANGLNGSTIRVGQALSIPDDLMAMLPVQITFSEHTISRGETLSGIAQNYSVPMRRIRETNQLNNDTIRIGQTLRIPSS